MAGSLSERFAKHFALKLPPDLAAWLDQGMWRESSRALYGEPYDPEALFEASSAPIWGGAMLPDTLPLLGDGCGDALCMRIGGDGRVTEFISWDHETGEWRSEGRTLAEALIYDVVRLPPDEGDDVQEHLRFAEWAVQWVGLGADSFADFIRQQGGFRQGLRSALIRQGIAEIPLRENACEVLLTSPLEQMMVPGEWQNVLGDEIDAFSPWPFDLTTVPITTRLRLGKRLRKPEATLFAQDWPGASEQAERVRRMRPDLAWPHGVLGWEAERRGDLAAVQHYARGLRTLGGCEGMISRWKPVQVSRYMKFAVLRLEALWTHLPASLREDTYLRAHLEAEQRGANWLDAVTAYWVSQGELAEAEERHADAYRCYYYACCDYDRGVDSSTLERLAKAAAAAGSDALHRVAELHAHNAPSPDEREAARESVAHALEEGKADLERMLELHREGRSAAEIASLMGCPPDQVEDYLMLMESIGEAPWVHKRL